MATNYARGSDFERRTKEQLEGFGYAVIRSAGSHSPADLVAMRHGEIVGVQCKRNGRLYPEEWNEFVDWCETAGAIPVVAQIGANHRGTVYHLITGRKTGAGRQPWVPWEPRKEES